MRKILFLISMLMFSMAGIAQQFIHASVKKNAIPGKIDIVFQPNYSTVAGEYVNYFQFSVAIPAAGNSGVTATASGVGPMQDMGALVASGPFLENTSDGQELVYNFGFLNPSPPTPVNHYTWTSGVDFTGVTVTFSTTAAASVGKLVDFTNSDAGFGGTSGNSLYGIVTNTGDKSDFSGFFYAIPCTSFLGSYSNPGSGIPDIYAKTVAGPGTVTGASPLCINATAIYSASGDPGGTWSSSNPGIAVVDATSGAVTGVSAGTVNIIYTVCGNSASAVLTVTGDPSPGTVSGASPLCIGGGATYTTTGSAGGTWSSSDPGVATVNPTTGAVTAVSPGTASIIYSVTTCSGGTLTASATVTVNANVNAGTVIGTAISLCIGQSINYISTGDPGGTWSSSNPSVAIVNPTGLISPVTGTGAGTAMITYTISSGCGAPASASAPISVSPNASAGVVSGASPLCIGQVFGYGSTGDAFGIWSSSNAAVASVDGSGNVTANAAGNATITYTVTAGCNAPVSASATVTVNPNANAGSGGNPSVLCIGQSVTLSSDGDVGGTWGSSVPSVASVNAAGVVTALSFGGTTVTYTVTGCNGPSTSLYPVMVNMNANAGAVSGASPLCIGASTLYSSTGDAGGSWSSNNTSVATVDAGGNVTAVGAGNTTITYTVTAGCNAPFSASATLTVNANASAGVVTGASPLCIGQSALYSSTGDAGGTWSSSNAAVATVDASGNVTATGAGSAQICYTVTAGCNAPFTTCATITVNPDANAGVVTGASPLCIGASATYSSTGDAGGTWSSSNAAVASVSATGVVTANAAGNATITYTVAGCNGPATASATLTVSPNASAGVVSGPTGVCIGQTVTYSSTGDAGGTWSSSDPGVAVVDNSGNVTATGAGNAQICYTVTAGCNAPFTSCATITVNPNANAGTVSGNSPICTNTNAQYSASGDAGGTWSSSDPSVATVNATSGLVSALAVGTTDITYTVAGCNGPASATKNLSVIPTVTAGTVTGASPLCIGQTTLYTTDGNPGGSWSSSNTSVATVDASTGAVTAVGAGNTVITYSLAACGGGTLTASQALTVNPNANAGTISGPATLCIGANAAYSTSGDAGGTWSSSDPTISIDPMTGVVTALSAGPATITYTVSSGCNAPVSTTFTLVVNPTVNAGTVSGASPLCIGAVAAYSSTGDGGGTWSSSNASVATVNASTGAVTAVGAGNTTITYTITSGCGAPASASQTLIVDPNANAGTISGVSPLCIGVSATFTSNGDAGGTWSSSNPLVASVDGSGVVTANAAGNAIISYTVSTGCNNPVTATFAVTVNPNVSAGTVSGASPLCIGFNAVYSSTGTPGGTWSSSDPSVATVSATGVVTAIGAGNATITYTVNGCGGPVSASANLTVNPNVTAGTVSGPSPLCAGVTVTYTSSGTPGGTWSSSNPAVATVNASTGDVTTLSVGNTTITYTVSGCGGTRTASKALSVTATLTAGTVNGNTPLCLNATAAYTSTGSTGGTWSSSNPAVASVSATGLVTALSAGTTNITYTVNSCSGPVSSSKNLTVIGGYTITSSAGPNGTISPLGSTLVPCGGRQTYTITPASCYKILAVFVDSVFNAAATLSGSYTFNPVNGPHTISATFTPAGPFTITLTATGSGTTVPVAPDVTTVPCGGGATYSFTATAGNHIGTVLINGVNNPGAVSSGSYTFTNVQANSTIQVNFVPDCTQPTVSISAAGNPFCANLTLTANALPAGPAYTYQWYRNGVAITGATAQTLALTGNPSSGSYQVVASVASCVSPFSAPYSYNSTNTLQSYTILATENVDLGENNIVLHGSVGNTKNDGQVQMKKGASVASAGAFVRAKKINIQSPSNVPNQILSPAVATLPAMQLNTSSTTGLSNITITSNGTYAGNYKDVTVKTGVIATLTGSIFNNITIQKGAQVTFTSGVLNINHLDVKDGGSASNLTKVKFATDCVIRAKDMVNIGKYCQINPTSRNVVFYCAKDFNVDGKGTTVRSSVYAPNGTIDVHGDDNVTCFMTGRFIAKKVTSDSKNVTWDSFDCANPPAPLFAPEAENSFAPGGITSSDGAETKLANRLDVKAYPNPSANSFNLKLTTTLLSEQVMIRITDVSGRVLQQLKGTPDQVFHVGDMLKAGIYFAELQQGSQKVSVKLIKQ